jgi:hypothetical protein
MNCGDFSFQKFSIRGLFNKQQIHDMESPHDQMADAGAA